VHSASLTPVMLAVERAGTTQVSHWARDVDRGGGGRVRPEH